jgi:hypothetical protein
MKRILTILAVVTLVAVTAQAEVVEVRSANVAGVVNVDVAAGALEIVGVDLDGFDGTPTLESLFGAQAVAASSYADADQVLVYDPVAVQYDCYAKYDVDGLWYRCNNLGEWNAGTVQTNLPIPVGSAVWVRCNPSSAQNFSLTGEAVANAASSMGLAAGLQMVAYPFSSKINLDATGFADDGATANSSYGDADQVIFWDTASGTYQRYALYDGDNKWYGCNDLPEWNAGSVLGSAKDIGVGEGFWYRSVSGLTWTEDNPYLSYL